MNEIIETLLTAQSKYESAMFDLQYAPKGNPMIDADIKETAMIRGEEYKQVLVDAIAYLAETLKDL